MDTAVDEARRLIESVEASCEYRSAHGVMTCSTEAEWVLRVSCGDSTTLCDEHAVRTRVGLQGQGRTLHCARHGGMRVLYDWERL